MSHLHTARNLVLATLLSGLPSALVAQSDGSNVNDVNQDNTAYGTTAAEFLLLGAGARGTALGSSFSAIANDASALYYNPAGIALGERSNATLGTYDYVADTRYSWAGIMFPFSGGSRAIGLQGGTFGFKDQPVYTVEQPDGTGSVYSVSESFLGVTFAQNFSDRFSAGLTAKGVFDNLGDATGRAFAVDFGTNFHATLSGHPVKFSFVLANLGTSLSYSGAALDVATPRDPIPGEQVVPENPQPSQFRTKSFNLPTSFRVGLAYDLITGESNHLSVIGDFNQPNNNGAGFGVGGEWMSQKVGGSPFGFAVRGSYSYTAANNLTPADPSTTALSDEENLQGLAFGGGLNFAKESFNIGVDYAWKYLGVLGGTNFFSVSLGW
ncbi:MAG: PorV/PorQ family protein [Gemmatimonadales bacterium]